MKTLDSQNVVSVEFIVDFLRNRGSQSSSRLPGAGAKRSELLVDSLARRSSPKLAAVRALIGFPYGAGKMSRESELLMVVKP